MKTINFFGGPSAGKSTTASGLFYEMKRHWIECEYIQEYAKELIWSDHHQMLSHQNYILAEQEYRLNRLNKKIDVAISDAPLLFSSFYAPSDYPDAFHDLVFHFFNTYDNINIFVKRSHDYSLLGRIQNATEGDYVAGEMENFLQKNGVAYWSMTASDASPKRLLKWLIYEQKLISDSSFVEKLIEKNELNAQQLKDFPKSFESGLTFHPPLVQNNHHKILYKANLTGIKTF